MHESKSINGKKISGHINRLRQLGHNLGTIREHRSTEGPDETTILSEIKKVAEDIKGLIQQDPIFSQDFYFTSLPASYESMVSAVRNSYEIVDLLLRDEIVFQLDLKSSSGFKHWLSMRPHEFKSAVEHLLNQANTKTQ